MCGSKILQNCGKVAQSTGLKRPIFTYLKKSSVSTELNKKFRNTLDEAI
jgi:hypothetical protein